MIASRLLPGQDLKKGIQDILNDQNLKSGFIISIVGSLNVAVLRTADGNNKFFKGPLEIVSAEGTVSADGIHVHISISDINGMVYGGHLMNGCEIHTTAEIGILESKKEFKRVFDKKTGYSELLIDE
ncbi:MAG: DNA-binding protein [Methanobacteriaceae archaeon]|nr:DNA-binding protein [Methanobacteriaceae archaeon]